MEEEKNRVNQDHLDAAEEDEEEEEEEEEEETIIDRLNPQKKRKFFCSFKCIYIHVGLVKLMVNISLSQRCTYRYCSQITYNKVNQNNITRTITR